MAFLSVAYFKGIKLSSCFHLNYNMQLETLKKNENTIIESQYFLVYINILSPIL